MYRKYKVTSGDCRKQPTGHRATHPQGKWSQTSLEAPPTGKTSTLTDQKNAIQQQQQTSSLTSSSTVAMPTVSPTDDETPSSVGDTVGMATVEAAWKAIDEQSVEEMLRREEAANSAAAANGKAMEGWKIIRVFVSSTFADMHSEREILVKKVFPQLREWCEERKFSLVDCDLRWGVPKDSTSRITICTCLEEIDRCHDDNERLPFFVSILSDRYGWIPSESEVPEDVKEKYRWVPQVSITHMEILHGAYRFSNPNAIFCLRNASYIEDLPQDKVSRFLDQDLLSQLQLKALKEKLVSKFPKQVFEYSCRVDGLDMSTGREKVNIVGLESFAERVLEFLKEAINRQYPDHHLATELSPTQTENNAHDAAMQTKSEFFVGRSDELESLFAYIQDGRTNSQMLRRRRRKQGTTDESNEDDEEKEEEEEKRKKMKELKEDCSSFGVRVEDSRIVAVVGQPGIGKSSLLAKLARRSAEEGLRVLYHSVGATDVSASSNGIIRRIVDSLRENTVHHHQQQQQQQQQQQEVKSPEENEEVEDLVQQLKDALADAAMNGIQLLVIIDGLDECVDNQTSQFLSWLPPRFPGQVRCAVSCAVDHFPCVARLESRDSLFMDLVPLTPDGAASMAQFYLQRFNKRLDSSQLVSLLIHRSSCIPLWLSIACEELRIFGDFATVSAKIQNFPEELNDLMKDVIQRLIREDETRAMQKVLSWICCSQSGLPEKAILSLLGNPVTKEQAPMVTWATVRRHLKPFIRSTGESQSIRIRMAHTSMNKAVEELFFCVESEREEGKDETYVIQCHTYLADFYQYHCSYLWMTLSELPHHLYHAKLGQRMIDFYRTDKRTTTVTGFERSKTVNRLRCQCFVQNPHDDKSQQLYACSMCSLRSCLLSPSPMPTRDMCAICGNWVPWKQPTNVARVCMKHRTFAAPTTTKCYLCSNVIFLQSSPHMLATPLYLCNYCHVTGSSMMKCTYLNK